MFSILVLSHYCSLRAMARKRIPRPKINVQKVKRKIAYGLGEVTFVVCGVLIAFLINSWNTERDVRREKITILEGIRQDILLDTIDLNLNIRTYHQKMRADSVLFKILSNRRSKSDTIISTLKQLYLGADVYRPMRRILQQSKNTRFTHYPKCRTTVLDRSAVRI